MTILKKLIPVITKLDIKLSNMYVLANSWVFYNIKGGYKCTVCGAKHLRFSSGHAESRVDKSRMLLHWYSKTGTVCPVCAQKAINEVFENYRKGITDVSSNAYSDKVTIGDCDFSGLKDVPVIGIIWSDSNSKGIDVRIGREWWNGFKASQYALEMGILNCEMESSMSKYINGKIYYNAGKDILHKSKQSYREFVAKNFT